MCPNLVNAENQEAIWLTLYANPESRKPKLKVGNQVRLSMTRMRFRKGYLPGWTDELFQIAQVFQDNSCSSTSTDEENISTAMDYCLRLLVSSLTWIPILVELYLQLQSLTSFIFERLRTLLCVLCIISLSRPPWACCCIRFYVKPF